MPTVPRSTTTRLDAFVPDSTVEVGTQTLGALERLRRRVLGFEQAPRIGGRYEPHAVIGFGGMGLVISVTDHQLGRRVALKVLRQATDTRDLDDDEARYRSLRAEAQALARVSHPNVVPVFDIGRIVHRDRLSLPVGVPTGAGAPYLVMELVDGGSLDRWLSDERGWNRIRHAFVESAKGLAAAHDAGIVHRDFKPSNVLVSRAGVVKVVDFGIAVSGRAHEITTRRGPGHAEASSRARLAEIVGTPLYMAPEQLRGEPVDARADQFAWCVALHCMVFGKSPYPAGPDAMIAAKQRKVMLREPLPKGVPRGLRELLSRGLDPSPAARHPSMAALAEALAGLSVAPRPWPWMLGGIVLLAGGGALQSSMPNCDLPASIHGGAASHGQLAAVSASIESSVVERTVSQASAGLHARASEWKDARSRACTSVADRREEIMGCLRGYWRRLETIVVAIDAGGVSSRSRALAALGRVGNPDHCFDPATNSNEVIETELRAELVLIETLIELGQLARAWTRIGPAVRQARLGLDTRALARALLIEARLTTDGSCAEDRARLEDAFYVAADGEHVQLASEAARRVSHVLASCVGDPSQARRWLDQARSWQQRGVPEPSALQAMRLAEAAVLMAEDQGPRAEVIYEEVLERVRAGEPWGPDYGRFLMGYIKTLGESGRVVEAAEVGREVVAEITEAVGPAHPLTGEAIVLVATPTWQAGHKEDAIGMIQEGLAVLRATYGPDHRTVLKFELNEISMLAVIESHAETFARYDRLIPRLRARFGEGHFFVSMCERNRLNEKIDAATFMGDPQALSEAGREVERIAARDDMGPVGRAVRDGFSQFARGRVLLAQGRFETALQTGHDLMDLARADGEVNASMMWRGQMIAAHSLSGLGRHDEAVGLLVDSVQTYPPQSDHFIDAAFTIASFLAIGRRHTEAREWADRAVELDGGPIDSFRQVKEGLARGLAELDAGHVESAIEHFEYGLAGVPDHDIGSDLRFMLRAGIILAKVGPPGTPAAREALATVADDCWRAKGQASRVCADLQAGRLPGRPIQ